MKKIFCLCMIITLGAHSMQGGIFSIQPASRNTGAGAAAIVFGVGSGLCLFTSFYGFYKFNEIEEKRKILFNLKETPKYRRVMGLTAMGIIGALSGYLAYELGCSSLEDEGPTTQGLRRLRL